MSDLTIPPSVSSPFDQIRRTREDGTEFWSARELAQAMQYDQWRNFVAAIERARVSVRNQGYSVADHLAGASKMVTIGSGAERRVSDVHLSRFGAYITVMNADPRKPEVAAAQAYFAVRTREAETRPAVDAASLTRLELLQIAINAEEERLALEAQNAELAPRAEAYDSFIDATGHYSVGAVAKMIGSSQNRLFRDLRNNGVLIAKGAMKNTPYQQYMRHFVVKAREYERADGETGTSYTTYVQPSGIAFIRRRLGLTAIDPIPHTGGGAA